MRFLAVLLVAVLCAPSAHADGPRLRWPLHPRPAVTRGFDAPAAKWNRGHRGVDLAATAGQSVHAAGPGTVVFAGELPGRPLVSIAHPGGLRTSYEPVRPAVRAGQHVGAGDPLGVLVSGHPGCPVASCLHWGAMWGAAARADYVDPLGLIVDTPIRLKPLGGGRSGGQGWRSGLGGEPPEKAQHELGHQIRLIALHPMPCSGNNFQSGLR